MDFNLTREQEMLRNMVREFAEKDLAPKALELDNKGEFPADVIKKMCELGLGGTLGKKEYGGSAMGHLASILSVEEISRVYPPAGFCLEGIHSAIALIQNAGTEEQKKNLLPRLIKGEKIPCVGVTEATGGSDPSVMQTVARPEGDEFVIDGRKVWITLAPVADIICFLATVDGKATAFYVEDGTPGFEKGHRADQVGLKSVPIGEFAFTGCRIPRSNMIGKEGGGLPAALTVFSTVARPNVAAIALGVAEGAYEVALKYCKERKLYGAPIANLQAIQFSLADMSTEIEAARWLCYYGVWKADQGKSVREVAVDTARAKVFATEVAIKTCVRATQLMGGYGLSPEYEVIRRLQDALELFPAAGTSEIMRVTIGRSITR